MSNLAFSSSTGPAGACPSGWPTALSIASAQPGKAHASIKKISRLRTLAPSCFRYFSVACIFDEIRYRQMNPPL
jgi:hypothetical protein